MVCGLFSRQIGIWNGVLGRLAWLARRPTLKLISREIIFEVFQPMWSRYMNVTDGQTNRRTTCCGITAPCVASRGKKWYLVQFTLKFNGILMAFLSYFNSRHYSANVAWISQTYTTSTSFLLYFVHVLVLKLYSDMHNSGTCAGTWTYDAWCQDEFLLWCQMQDSLATDTISYEQTGVSIEHWRH